MTLYRLEQVEFSYRGKPVLQALSCQFERGAMVGIVGPNGSGKTTLLRLLAGGLVPAAGAVLFDGRVITRYPRRDLARRIAVVPQEEERRFGFTVREAVLLGRTPHLTDLQREGPADVAAAEEAMKAAGVDHLAGALITELSGGEGQRVVLARALAQEPEVLLLDEPTSHLDVHYQAELLDGASRLHRQGKTVIVTLHDLNLAALYCERIILLSRGRLIADDTPEQVFGGAFLQQAYGPRVRVGRHPLGTPCVYITPGHLPPAHGDAGETLITNLNPGREKHA